MTPSPARDALAAIAPMITHTDACDRDPYAEYDAHDRADIALRDCLLALDDDTYTYDAINADPKFPADYSRFEHDAMRALITMIYADEYSRDAISQLCLTRSICPIHFIDYCACFDDDNPECAAIRIAFPNHDT